MPGTQVSLWAPITECGGDQNLAIVKGFLMFNDQKSVQIQRHYESEEIPAEPTRVALCEFTKPEPFWCALCLVGHNTNRCCWKHLSSDPWLLDLINCGVFTVNTKFSALMRS